MVLIINKSKKRADEVADIFRYMGIVSLGTTPKDALRHLSPAFRAVLMCDPDTIPDVRDYLRRMRSYISSPIFCLFTGNCGDEDIKALFDGCFSDGSYSSTIAVGMAKISKSRGLLPAGIYKLAGINASCDIKSVTFLDEPVHFTRTEAMILRFLISTYPTPCSPDSIIEHAFRSGKHPEPSAVRTHISVMNKKFRAATGRTLFISVAGEGYVVSTPELRIKYGICSPATV